MNKPHLKIWAVIEGPIGDQEMGDQIYLSLQVTGPENHNEVRNVDVYFEDVESAWDFKKEVDETFEPIIKEITDE